MLSVVLSAAFVGASSASNLFTEDVNSQNNLWSNFKNEFKREYANEAEEKTRFGYFLDNLKKADARQLAETRAGGEAKHGVTTFSDRSEVSLRFFPL